MIKTLLILAVLIALGAGFVVYVAPTFMPTATEVVTPDISAIDKAKAVVEKAAEKSGGATLNMSNRALTSVPKEVFEQTYITTLDLSNNGLSGSLPAEVRHLSALETLDLSDNKFTGVPAEVGQLTELRVLDLSNNPITGLPYEIGNLQKLEKLDLSGTKFSTADLEIIREKLPPDTVIVTD